jgi:hypothetical protein
LIIAADFGYLETVHVLLEWGADKNLRQDQASGHDDPIPSLRQFCFNLPLFRELFLGWASSGGRGV